MAPNEIERWLQAGVAAAKDGDREQARSLLLKVVQADEQNERAWLWLSGVVDSIEDRRICLENVLTLNPDHEVAQRGLARLQKMAKSETAASPPPSDDKSEEVTFRRQYEPVSPAAAVLYPDAHQQELRWREPKVQQQETPTEFVQDSGFDDVWTQNVDMCAYCAGVLHEEDERCPHCNRNLISKRYTYPRPSTNMHIYWVLLAALGNIFMIQGLYNILVPRDYFNVIIYGIGMVIFFVLAVGVYLRQSWAHLGSIVLLAAVIVIMIALFIVPVEMPAVELPQLDPMISRFAGSLLDRLGQFLTVFQGLTAVLALFFGVFMTGSDFEQTETRLQAMVARGLRTGGDYHNAARRLAEKGMWATAVLHWQRAAAKETARHTYQRNLGEAYARLGFYQRSLDAYTTALKLAGHPDIKAQIQQTIQQVKQQQAAQEQAAGATPFRTAKGNQGNHGQ